MVKVTFRNLERSELAHEAVADRMITVFDRFPRLRDSRVSVTLSMENSPLQAGPDMFTVKVICQGGLYRGVILERSAPSLYIALADVVDRLLERLNRFGDKNRVRRLRQARQVG